MWREILIALAFAAAVVAVVWGAYAIIHIDTRVPSACAPTAIKGELRCVFPTEGRPAIVFVYPYEDGSAEVLAVDPDGEYKVP